MDNQHHPRNPAPAPPDDPSKKEGAKKLLSDAITKGINHETIRFAEDYGKFLANILSTSQLRNVFSEIRRIQTSDLSKNIPAFLLLKPKLAYTAARTSSRGGGSGAKSFCDFITAAVDVTEVNKAEGRDFRFKNFCDLSEAILAYHKAFGGKD